MNNILLEYDYNIHESWTLHAERHWFVTKMTFFTLIGENKSTTVIKVCPKNYTKRFQNWDLSALGKAKFAFACILLTIYTLFAKLISLFENNAMKKLAKEIRKEEEELVKLVLNPSKNQEKLNAVLSNLYSKQFNANAKLKGAHNPS